MFAFQGFSGCKYLGCLKAMKSFHRTEQYVFLPGPYGIFRISTARANAYGPNQIRRFYQ